MPSREDRSGDVESRGIDSAVGASSKALMKDRDRGALRRGC